MQPDSEPYLVAFNKTGNENSGFLASTQDATALPFAVKRVFWVYDTPEKASRGNHANKITEEIMVAVKGSVTVRTESKSGKTETFILDDSTKGLYIPAFCWLSIRFSPGTVLVCMASTDFEESDYIQDLTEFRKLQIQ